MNRPAVAVFLLTLAFLAPLTHGAVFLAGNDASRFAQIEALVDGGHPFIDDSKYAWTVDRVTVGGKDYSNKPPLLSVLGAGLYLLLQKATGLTFAAHEAATVWLLTFALAALPTAWLAASFFCALGRQEPIPFRVRCLATAALAAGTILTSFAGTLNNHCVTAALLFAAFRAAMDAKGWKAGLWTALAACIDIVPGVLFIPVFASFLAPDRRALARFGALLLAGAALFVAVDLAIVGHALPPKMVPGAVDHSSQFASSVAGVLLPESWTYPLECLFGWHGFFTVSPVLLFGVLGLGQALRTGAPLPRGRCLALAATLAMMIAGHVLLVGSYGGWSYGFRYLIPIIPMILFFAPPAIARHERIFGAVLAVSALFALIGAYNPWPPAYEQEGNKNPVAALVSNPIGGNASAFLQEHFPGAGLTRGMKALFISPSKPDQARYLALFYLDKRDAVMAENMKRIYQRLR